MFEYHLNCIYVRIAMFKDHIQAPEYDQEEVVFSCKCKCVLLVCLFFLKYIMTLLHILCINTFVNCSDGLEDSYLRLFHDLICVQN